MCTGSGPAHPTPPFSSSGAFGASKTLHFSCFLFFPARPWDLIISRGRLGSFRCDPLAVPTIPLRFRSCANHFHCRFTHGSVTVAVLLASFWHRPDQSYCSFVAVPARPGIPPQFYRYASLSCFTLAPPRPILLSFCSRPSPSQHSSAVL